MIIKFFTKYMPLLLVFALNGCSITLSDKDDVNEKSSKVKIKKNPFLYGNFAPAPPPSLIGYSLTVVQLNGKKINTPLSMVSLIEGENTVKVIYTGCPLTILFGTCALFQKNWYQRLSFYAKRGENYIIEKDENKNIVIRNLFNNQVVSKIL